MIFRVIYENGFKNLVPDHKAKVCREYPYTYHFDIDGVKNRTDARKKAIGILQQHRHGAVPLYDRDVRITHVIPADDYVRVWWNELSQSKTRYWALMSIFETLDTEKMRGTYFEERHENKQKRAKEAEMLSNRCKKWGDLPKLYRDELKKVSYLIVGKGSCLK